MAKINVTQVKSTIGTKPVHRKTMKALGLAGIGRTRTLPDSRDVRGMLAKVDHLVTIEALSDAGGAPAPTGQDGGAPAPTAVAEEPA